MLGRHDEDQLVDESSCHALLARSKRVPTDYPKVHLVPPNPFLYEGGVAYAQAQCHSGESLLECRNDAWKHVDPRRRAGADDQRATLELAEVGHGLAGTRHGREQSKGGLLEDPAGFSQGHLPSEAVEQARTQLALHLGHMLGKRGLTQMHGLGGDTETPCLGHGEEHFKLPKRRLHKFHLIRGITTSNWSLCKGTHTLGPVDVVRSEPGIRLVV